MSVLLHQLDVSTSRGRASGDSYLQIEMLLTVRRLHLSTHAALHLLEGAVHIVRDLLDLQLLVDQLVLDLVDPDVQPLDVHLRVLGLGLCSFQPGKWTSKNVTGTDIFFKDSECNFSRTFSS